MVALRACRKLKKAIQTIQEESDGENGNENDGDFTIADEDFLMTHMMDCMLLLAAMQKQEKQHTPANLANAQAAWNKVFLKAFSIMGTSLLPMVDGMEQPKRTTAAIDQLLEAFPVPTTTYLSENGGKGWLPLHWALVLFPLHDSNITEADLNTLYALDPMAMQTKHIADIESVCKGLNPAHLLCISHTSPISMQLVRSFSLRSPAAFAVNALHVACCFGTPTVELLQCLLQLDSTQTKKKVRLNNEDDFDHCPLGLLCFNLMLRADKLPNADDLVNCLLEVDKSAEVVGDAIVGCLDAYSMAEVGDAEVDTGHLYNLIERLLKANPEAAKHRNSDDYNLLHQVGNRSLPSQLCINIMKQILALHKDAVREADADSLLPVHYAVLSSDVEVVEFLLNVYPAAANAVTAVGDNLLDFLLCSRSEAVPNVRYLCSRYPAMVQQRNNRGRMPVHVAAAARGGCQIMPALYEAGGVEQFKMPIAHSTNADYIFNGLLPLHLFIRRQSDSLTTGSQATAETADTFRWLLRIHPEAAGIEGGVGANKKTAYHIAVDKVLPDYYLRLLLRAAPTLNPPELHRLNYEQRRMAMFLAFKAVTATVKAPLIVRLRGESKDLVRRVVSFL